MKYNFGDFLYLIKHDYYYRNQFKKIALIVCIGLIILSVVLIYAGSFIINPIIGFVVSNIPIVSEILFNYTRGFISSIFQQDLLNLLSPLSNNPNVAELKEIIIKYFDQLKNNSGIDFQSFQNFLATIKSVVRDGQVSASELEVVRKLLLN